MKARNIELQLQNASVQQHLENERREKEALLAENIRLREKTASFEEKYQQFMIAKASIELKIAAIEKKINVSKASTPGTKKRKRH